MVTFLTYTNCHSEICPGNICPGDICPFQEYLSSYWPNFDQTLFAQFFESLNFLAQNFVSPNSQQFFRPKLFWRHLSTSGISQLLLTFNFDETFWAKFVWIKFFCNQNFWGPKLFFNLNFLNQHLIVLTSFLAIFLDETKTKQHQNNWVVTSS